MEEVYLKTIICENEAHSTSFYRYAVNMDQIMLFDSNHRVAHKICCLKALFIVLSCSASPHQRMCHKCRTTMPLAEHHIATTPTYVEQQETKMGTTARILCLYSTKISNKPASILHIELMKLKTPIQEL